MSDAIPIDLPAPFRVSRLISSLWIPTAIHAAAALGVAEVLADGPRSSAEVARAVGAHPGALRRLLRALVVLELCKQTEDDAFELTELGACLREGVRDSVRSWALLWGGPTTMHAWGRLVDCVRTGDPVPTLEGRGSTFDELARDPARLADFNRSMVEMTKPIAGAIPLAYDFSGIRTIVDVGGGHGQLLPPILAQHADMKGIVFDLPHCRDGALRIFEKTRLAERCEFVGGSFFEAVPAGADAYILKSVIHDWDDDRAAAILRTCRAAMHGGSRVLLVEPVASTRMGTSPFDHMVASADMNMLVVAGGKERTEAEFRALLEAAGLRLTRVVPTIAMLSVIEARLPA
jgi:O-methyltransferase domain/Dimerisation domain